jgi:DNA-binding NarL/FixJ family response regulator
VTGAHAVVCTDDTLTSEALAVVLARVSGIASVSVVAEAVPPPSAEPPRATLLVVDEGRLQGVGGADAVSELKVREPSVGCLVLSASDDPDQTIDLLEAGVLGCVSLRQGLSELVRAVEAALRGEPTVSSGLIAPMLRQQVVRRRDDRATVRRFQLLSARELEVLGLLAGGHDQDEIADILVISPQTVRTHIERIRGKLGVRSRVHAAHLACEYGLEDRRVRVGGRRDPLG